MTFVASERRLEKLNILLKEEIAKILDRELEFPEGALITVTRVAVSQDAHYATAYLTVFGGDAKTVLEIVGKTVYHIQQLLNRRVRMRPVPRIEFRLDEEEVRREEVEKSLAELKQKGDL